MNLNRIFGIALVLSAVSGCATRPINEPIARFDPQAGYRPNLLISKRANNDPHTLFVLAFSGGGTRAAALSYGVLEELRRTEPDRLTPVDALMRIAAWKERLRKGTS